MSSCVLWPVDCVFFQLINSYSHVFGGILCDLDNQVITNPSNGIYYVKVETRVIMCYCSHSLAKEERVDVNEYWGLEKLFRPINTGCLLQGLRRVCGKGLAKYSLRLWQPPPPPPPQKKKEKHMWTGCGGENALGLSSLGVTCEDVPMLR